MFYTYLYLREDGTPYYVGKGKGNRAYHSPAHTIHLPRDSKGIIRSRIPIQYWESEEEAFEMERWYIKFYGRKDNGTGILRNLTDGGDGASGHVLSEESCNKIAVRLTGNKNGIGKKPTRSPEHCKAISLANTGKPGFWTGKKRAPVSDETRNKLRTANTRPWTPVRRAAQERKYANQSRIEDNSNQSGTCTTHIDAGMALCSATG